MRANFISAQDWIRTSTSLRTLRPEHSASTNFATWAEKFKVEGLMFQVINFKRVTNINEVSKL